MSAIQILQEWVNERQQGGMKLSELKLHYYDELVKEPINVAIIDGFRDMLSSDKAKAIYNNILDQSDQNRSIFVEPLRINRIFPLFSRSLFPNIQLMADMFSLFAENSFINYGCLTRMMILPIVPQNKGDEQYCLCYCYIYSNYTSDELNKICGSELFCPDYQPLSTLNHIIPSIENATLNIQKWFEFHKPYQHIVLNSDKVKI